MLTKIESDQDNLLDNMRESIFSKSKPLVSLLIQTYSCRGHANEMLQDYEQAYRDFNKLIELCQFQDLPTEKVFEYMTTLANIKSKLEAKQLKIKHQATGSISSLKY